MTTLFKQLGLALRRWRLLLRGTELSAPVRLGRAIRCRRGWRDGRKGSLRLGPGAWLEDGVVLDAWGGAIEIGSQVFLGPYVVIYGHGGVTIGDQTLVSMHCRILSSNHAVPPIGTDIRSKPDELRPTKIGRDVWLGAGVTVLGGVTIGDGCIVGAGAVVTHDLPAGAIAYGTPASVHGWRDGATRT